MKIIGKIFGTAVLLFSLAACIFLLFRVHTLEKQVQTLQLDVTQREQAERMMQEEVTERGTLREIKESELSATGNVMNAADRSNLAQEGDLHTVYLTFDDGPSDNTDAILDILARYDVKATFFVIGKESEEAKERYRRIVAEGHTLGMHSYTHEYDSVYASLESFEEDFAKIQNLLYDVVGEECIYYRFPGGSSNTVSTVDMSECISYLNSQGITYFDWNVLSGDATSTPYTPDELVENVVSNVVKYKESVVLMHDTNAKEATVEALAPMIEALKESGAKMLPIDENTTAIQHITADSVQ